MFVGCLVKEKMVVENKSLIQINSFKILEDEIDMLIALKESKQNWQAHNLQICLF